MVALSTFSSLHLPLPPLRSLSLLDLKRRSANARESSVGTHCAEENTAYSTQKLQRRCSDLYLNRPLHRDGTVVHHIVSFQWKHIQDSREKYSHYRSARQAMQALAFVCSTFKALTLLAESAGKGADGFSGRGVKSLGHGQ